MYKVAGLSNDRLIPDVCKIQCVAFSVDPVVLITLKHSGKYAFALYSRSLGSITTDGTQQHVFGMTKVPPPRSTKEGAMCSHEMATGALAGGRSGLRITLQSCL